MFGGHIQITYHCPTGSGEGDGQDNRSKKRRRGSSCCLVVNHLLPSSNLLLPSSKPHHTPCIYTMSIPMLLPSTSTIHAMYIQYPYQMANSDPTFGGAWDPPAFAFQAALFLTTYHIITRSEVHNCEDKTALENIWKPAVRCPAFWQSLPVEVFPTCLPV